MKNIATAVIKVMAEVKGMEKNSKVGTGASAYDGTKDQDVKEIFNDALQRNGLCILPIDIQETTQIDRWEEASQYGIKQKQSVFTKVTVKYMLLHESGESIELAGYGHGVDPQDKSAGKATTYALKNCLLYSFLTPVGKIDDTDLKHSNEIEVPKEVKPALDVPRLETRLKSCKTLDELGKTYLSFTAAEKVATEELKNQLKTQLT
jgi:hypothetical protein